MSKEMMNSLSLVVFYIIGVFFFEVWYIRLFCAFATGVNYEAFMVAWRIKRNEPAL